VLITREDAERSFASLEVDAAILVMEMEEVFVARIACEGQIWASWEKILVFRSGISGTASMTKSTSDRSSRDVLVVRRSRVAWASSSDILCLETSFARSLSANFRPLSIAAWDASISFTGTCAFCAATSAIPRPYGR
jgi:hypothetical protein